MTSPQGHASDRAAGGLYSYPDGDLAIVAHGTVISQFVAQHNRVETMSFWRGLGMPACVVLAMPGFELERVESTRE